MRINNIFNFNVNFGLLDSKLEQKMQKAILCKNCQYDIDNVKHTKEYRDFCYIKNHTKDSLLSEYNICDRIGFIYDCFGTIKNIDISKAYKEKNETFRYLKIIKIIAAGLKSHRS